MAEIIGRIISTSKIILPSSLKDYISLYDSIDSRQCVGLTKNNLLIEFDIQSEEFTRVHKISAAAADGSYENLKVIHDICNQYQVVVTQSSNQGLQVYKTTKQGYEMIFELRETFIEIEVDDEPTKGGYEILKIKLSPSRILVKEFSSFSFRTINDCGGVDLAEHEFNDAAEVALSKQSEHLNQAIQVVEKDLKKLKQLISDMTLNLSADVQTVKESDFLKAAFGKELLPPPPSDAQKKLVIKKVKSFDAKHIVITIENPLDGKIEDLKPVLNHRCFRFKETNFLNLDQKIKVEACELIMDKMGFVPTSREKTRCWHGQQQPQQTDLDTGENTTFVLDVMEVIETDIHIFFQFYYNEQLFVQSLKVNLAKNFNDPNTTTTMSCNTVEKFLVDLILYNFKESFHVKSHLERPFDLFLAVQSSGVAETKTSSKIAFSGSDVTCVIFKIDEFAYRLDIYSDEIKSIKRSLVKLYEKLPDDVMINVKRPPLLENNMSIDKKTALLQEITALKKGQKIDEIVTDLAFFT